MADGRSEKDQDLGSCQSCENERQSQKIPTNNFESVELKAAEGDVSDISEEEGKSGSGAKPKLDRPRKKIKKKRRSKSFTSNDEDTTSDEESLKTMTVQKKNPENVDLSNLTWTLWVWYYVLAVSTGIFHFAEFLGEKLADFFGITAPKYQYVIDEYYRMKREEEEQRIQEEKERDYVEKKEAEKLASLEGGDEKDRELQKDLHETSKLP